MIVWRSDWRLMLAALSSIDSNGGNASSDRSTGASEGIGVTCRGSGLPSALAPTAPAATRTTSSAIAPVRNTGDLNTVIRRSRFKAGLRQEVEWVYFTKLIVLHLKVEVGSGAIPCASHPAQDGTLENTISAADV